MINNWSKFNEKSDDVNSITIEFTKSSLSEILKDKISDIREVFYEFSDSGIIRGWSCEVSHNLVRSNLVHCFDNNFDKFIEDIISVIKPKDLYSLHSGDSQILIDVTLYLPGKESKRSLLSNSGAILPFESISILDDIVVASRRLKSLNFEIELDFNFNSKGYKPVVFKIRFNT